MKHFYTLLLLALLSPVIALSQSNYKAGYVVTLQGDTIKGYIDYREWSKNPSAVTFKKDIASKQNEQYTILNTSAFALYGFESYKRFVLWVSGDKTNVTDLTIGADTTRALDTVFLRVLNTGKNVTLYAYSDELKERFFISENGNQPVELIHRLYFDPAQNSNIITQNSYRLQLQQLAAKYQPDDKKLPGSIQNANYSIKYLLPLVIEINGMDKNSQFITTDRSRSQFFAGIAVNVINTRLNISAINLTGPNEFSNAKTNTTVLPGLVIGNDFYLNKNVGTVVLRVQMGVSYNSAKFSEIEQANSSDQFTSIYKFTQLTISFNPNLLVNIYNKPASKVYVEAGPSINYSFYGGKEYDHIYTVRHETDPQPFINLRSAWISLPVKAGVVINNRLDIYAAFTMPTNIADSYGFITLKSTLYQAGINYFFSKK